MKLHAKLSGSNGPMNITASKAARASLERVICVASRCLLTMPSGFVGPTSIRGADHA